MDDSKGIKRKYEEIDDYMVRMSLEDAEISEPLLKRDPHRFTMFPIKYPDIWEAYQTHKKAFWVENEIDYSADKDEWNTLTKDEKYFIEHILAFFAGSDGIVLENLIENFSQEIHIPEVRAFYGFQAMMENIHCVSGDTFILTPAGFTEISTLVGQDVDVWNGEQYSKVTVKATGRSTLKHVVLSNGLSLKCTPTHEWYVQEEEDRVVKKYTYELIKNDRIANYKIPTVYTQKGPKIVNAYRQGFLSTLNTIPCPEQVPLSANLVSKIQWVQGFSKCNGIVVGEGNDILLKIVFPRNSEVFAQRVQLLFLSLGVYAPILKNVMELSKTELQILQRKGFVVPESRRTFFDVGAMDGVYTQGVHSDCNASEDGRSKHYLQMRDIYVMAIDDMDGEHETYCFEEPLRHRGNFNGIETGQSTTYSLLIEAFVNNEERKKTLFEAIETIPCVSKKAKWAQKWMDREKSTFAERLVAFAVVEGIFFSGSFCAIFWLKSRGKMTRALGVSNELISRDEGLHQDFAALLYSKLQKKLTRDRVLEIVTEAVEIEREFICTSLPCDLIGMNSNLMYDYIKYVADRLIEQLGYEKHYESHNPFDFMDRISMYNHNNFFETRGTNYQLAASLENKNKEFAASDF